jgi:hypothetical protein
MGTGDQTTARRKNAVRKAGRRPPTNAFEIVRDVGITLPGVEAATRYDGTPVLKLHGINCHTFFG